jgi:hypothetical protein
MKRLLRGSVVLAVAVGFLSCSGDPTDGFREPSGIVASPTTVFVDVGQTKPVIVSLQDEQGNQIASAFEISDVGSGVTVVQDTAFQHTNAGVTIPNQARFQVTGTAVANSSFTLSAGGETLVVPVRVTPGTLSFGISNPTPAWGDTITITAPVGSLFTDSSVVTFAGGPPGDIVSLSPDRTQLVVVPGPNTLCAVTVSHTTVAFNEALDFTITSIETVTSPPLTDLTGATFSNATPALGETVTLTLPPGIKVIPDSFLADSSPGVLADSGIVVEGAMNPVEVVVSADSSSISFVPAPNSDSVITIRGVVPAVLPQFPQILATTTKLTTPSIDSLAVVFSDQAPDILEEITVTAPAGFHFDTTAQFLFGGLPAIIGSIAPGGGSADITPLPGATGVATISGVVVDAAPQFLLTLPSTTAITVAAVTPLEGTGTPATAPTITMPGPGGSTTINDAGTFDYAAPIFGGAFGLFPARLYKIVVPAPLALTVTVAWPTGQDLGVYYFAADGTTEPPEGNPADCCGAGVTPESSTSSLLAGTYILAVVNFGVGDPPVFSLTIAR